MLSNKLTALAGILIMGLVVPASSEAQASIGVRAQGLAGAFVGVADDASAVYWNPSGLATGSFVSFVADFGRGAAGPEGGELSPAGAERQTSGIVALSAPPVGIAYYRIATFGAGPRESVVSGVPGREEVRRSVQALTTSTVGVSLLQSVGQYVVVGASLKLLKAEAARGFSREAIADAALDEASALSGRSEMKGDLDLSAMSAIGHIRLGVVAHNLTTPSFVLDESGREAVELQRQLRIGGAWGSGWPGNSRVVLAVDADATTRVALGGDRRDLAAGVETWWWGQRVGVRSGARRSTVGDARSVWAGGLSVAVKAGMFLEGHVAGGSRDEHSWSVGARASF